MSPPKLEQRGNRTPDSGIIVRAEEIMRTGGIIVAAIVGVALFTLFGYPRLLTHGLELRVQFQNANRLRAGAPVRLAGVEVGRITSVRARPEMRAAPAEVRLKLQTPYELSIPNDATVSLATAGVLGETFAEINVEGASGPPVKNGEALKERQTKSLTTEELIQKFADIVQRRPCAPRDQDTGQAGASINQRN